MTTKIDLVRWRADHASAVSHIRELKAQQRASGQPAGWTWREGSALLAWKRTVTELYVLRARLRGRVHSPAIDAAAVEKIVNELTGKYAVPLAG
jgi:hypothetical protein